MTCALAAKDCAGRLEWHHVIKQQRLRKAYRYGAILLSASERPRMWTPAGRYDSVKRTNGIQMTLSDILGDTRNRVFLCSHHHELVSNGRLKVELPDSVWEFAAEFGLTAMLESDLRKAA